MAEQEDVLIPEVGEAAQEVPINGTKIPSTPEGMAIAYTSLVVMALVPIFFGAFRSVRYHQEQQKVSMLSLSTEVESYEYE